MLYNNVTYIIGKDGKGYLIFFWDQSYTMGKKSTWTIHEISFIGIQNVIQGS